MTQDEIIENLTKLLELQTKSEEVAVDLIRAAVLAERAACARLRKEITLKGVSTEDYENGFWDALELYETAIRARSEK